MNTAKIVIVSFITSVITSVAVVVILNFLHSGQSLTAPSDVEVPSVLGLMPDQARMILQGRSLFLVIAEQREDAKFEKDHIIQQNPMQGSLVKRSSTVQVVISTGQSKVQVPGVVGLPLNEATRSLSNAGLKAGAINRQPSDSVEVDRVIASLPLPGEEVDRNAAVDMVVSSGSEQAPVPSVTGKSLRIAKEELAKAGLTLGKVSYAYDEDQSGGIVLRQNPAAGSTIKKGDVIDLVVNESD